MIRSVQTRGRSALLDSEATRPPVGFPVNSKFSVLFTICFLSALSHQRTLPATSSRALESSLLGLRELSLGTLNVA